MMHSCSAAAMTIVRSTRLSVDLHTNLDPVYQYVLFFIWNAIEVNALIISSCIPTLMPFWEFARVRAVSWYKTVESTTVSHKHQDRDHALSPLPFRIGRHDQSLKRQSYSKKMYINLDAEDDSMGFGEKRNNKSSAFVSAPGIISDIEQGIHVTREVDVTNCHRASL